MAEKTAIKTSDKSLNIYQKMLKAQSMIETVAKNIEIDAGKQRSYKAVNERDVLDAVKKAEQECGIYSFPYSREIYETKETKNQYGTVSFWMRFKVVYRFVNVDDTNDYIDITSYGDGVDSLDKAPGKGMTYADKYALMKAYKISTGDDADKEASTEQTEVKEQHHKSIDELVYEWSKCRKKLSELGVDYRSESISSWIAEKTGCDNQDADMNNPEKIEKVNQAYRTLIKSKMEEGSYEEWLNQ